MNGHWNVLCDAAREKCVREEIQHEIREIIDPLYQRDPHARTEVSHAMKRAHIRHRRHKK